MDLRFPFSPAEVAKVRLVQFGILSPDEIVILSISCSVHYWLGFYSVSVNDAVNFVFVAPNVGCAYRAQ